MTNNDKACEILSATKDGDLLSPYHLDVLQTAVNNQLSPRGQELFDALYTDVTSGQYTDPKSAKFPWMYGIENLTQDHEGYVYWRGKQVEHYSYSSSHRDEAIAAAKKLASNCILLEEKGFPVNSRTAIDKLTLSAPAGTPWLAAMTRYYTFFEKEGEPTIGIFYPNHREEEPLGAFACRRVNGELQTTWHEGAYEAYHHFAAKGFSSADHLDDYDSFAAVIEKTGVTAPELAQLIG